jgi:hypothetical protein
MSDKGSTRPDRVGAGKRLVSTLMAVATLSLVAWAGFGIGQAWGEILSLSRLTFGTDDPTRTRSAPFLSLPFYSKLRIAATEALGLDFATDGQDKWIAQVVFPGVRDGFYLDIGSGDGVYQSNSKMLDDLGWDGICVDPFPANMETRTARVIEAPVDSRPGRKVSFRASGFIGGIEDHLDKTKDWPGHKGAPTVELVTTTLDEILSNASAPSYIHYLSLDIEGAEFEALRGFSFSKHTIGAITVEHNWEQPKRERIRTLLSRNGYLRVLSHRRDDYYLHATVLQPR